VACRLADEADALADVTVRSKKLGTTLAAEGERVRIML
jgi:hypothetical protein